MTSIEVADALRVASNRAADLLEQLDIDNSSMKSSSLGVLSDGTPVEDVVEELRETKIELARMHAMMRHIAFHVNRKSVERADAIACIRRALQERQP